MTGAGRVVDSALAVLLAATVALPFLAYKNTERPGGAPHAAAKLRAPASAVRHHRSPTAPRRPHLTHPAVTATPRIDTTATAAPVPTPVAPVVATSPEPTAPTVTTPSTPAAPQPTAPTSPTKTPTQPVVQKTPTQPVAQKRPAATSPAPSVPFDEQGATPPPSGGTAVPFDDPGTSPSH
jgi:hypothetical protein